MTPREDGIMVSSGRDTGSSDAGIRSSGVDAEMWWSGGDVEREASPSEPVVVVQGPVAGRWGWLIGSVWLVYLGDTVQAVAQHTPGFEQVLGAVALVAFVVLYLGMFALNRTWRARTTGLERLLPQRTAASILAGMLVLFAATVPAAGATATTLLVFVVASAVTLLPLRRSLVVLMVLLVGTEIAGRVIDGWAYARGAGLAMLLAGVAVWGIRLAMDRNLQLVLVQKENARLAVVDERARMARDVHDILGHSLTVITIKAELAGRLMEVDTARAAAEIADVERLSRDALADVRAAISGYREMSLAGEVASARSALTAAGIEADVMVDDVPPSRRELFGWAVREGVTNVVRHSRAQRCVVTVGPDFVEVLDDGGGPRRRVGPDEFGQDAVAETGGGHGLTGLEERAERAGATLSAGHRHDAPGFRLRLQCPPATPATAVPR